MSRTRKNYPAPFKTKVVIAALREDRPASELASQFGVHSTVIGRWRREALASMEAGFSGKLDVQQNNHALEVKELHAKIGQLTVERGFFVRSLQPLDPRRRKEMVVAANINLSITVQCHLLSVSRSSWYYNLKGESLLNLALMRLIDEQFLLTPYYGSRQMARHLRRQGYCVGRHRIRRLMRIMGLRAIYQEPRTSVPHPEHKIYPYLLRSLAITRPNQVWCTDITYIPIKRGFLYLVAVMDWYSRRVLSWRLSNSMDVSFCLEALEEAFSRYGQPEIFNTDQGSQFTSFDFTSALRDRGIKISMDGRGRWMDNVFIERLWRSLKYECVYLNAFDNGLQARQNIGAWLTHYNHTRPHSTFNGQTPDEVYTQKIESQGHGPDIRKVAA
ncbi:MAG: IS3 family transposase [Emcibacter sp.]|nr:IS3 family transposase [Emcibacter sp.]